MQLNGNFTRSDRVNGMSRPLVVVLFAMQMGLQPITTDLYLPALPMLSTALGGTLTEMQMTLSAMLLSFGLSQLLWGQLSDAFGRCSILIAGLLCFVLGAAGSALSQSAAQLVGWRENLAAIAVFGAICLITAICSFEETLVHRDPEAMQPGKVFRNIASLVGDARFLLYSTYGAASYLGLFTILATSSFVFIRQLGETRLSYSLLMILQSGAYIVGTQLCRILLPRLGTRRLNALGGVLCLCGGMAAFSMTRAGVPPTELLVAANVLYMSGHGVNQPCSQSLAIGRFPWIAGMAASLSGFLVTVVAFGMGQWLGHQEGDIVAGMGTGVLLSGVVSVACGLVVLVLRDATPHSAPA